MVCFTPQQQGRLYFKLHFHYRDTGILHRVAVELYCLSLHSLHGQIKFFLAEGLNLCRAQFISCCHLSSAVQSISNQSRWSCMLGVLHCALVVHISAVSQSPFTSCCCNLKLSTTQRLLLLQAIDIQQTTQY